MAPHAIRSLSDIENERGEYEIPDGYGLMIRLDCEDGSVSFESVPDQHYTEIHPNCYAPDNMADVRLLHGGGSGTAVFHGNLPNNSMVMKHANSKDTREVFSLASISEELLERSYRLSPQAARSMRSRIPEFVMIYLSPYHLRDRGAELWASLRGAFWCNQHSRFGSHSPASNMSFRAGSGRGRPSFNTPPESGRPSFGTPPDSTRHMRLFNPGSVALMSPHQRKKTMGSFRKGMRSIRIRKIAAEEATSDQVAILVGLTSVVLEIPDHLFTAGSESKIEKGIPFLQQFEEELVQCQSEQNWKVTLAQKTIGGPSPQNGAVVLTSGNLVGKLRGQLVDNFVSVVKDLGELTYPNERPALEKVRAEVEMLRNNKQDVTKVSKLADAFVGSAIRKNFHPVKGRFVKLREFGEDLRCGDFYMQEQEQFPGMFLGLLLKRRNPLGFVFKDPPTQHFALDLVESSWFSLLEEAVSLDNPNATDCIWTCGLTDAGLHNTFLSKERGLELFDMGEATVLPRPAFLTKFLMSFFHTAGMEESGTKSMWTRRFYIVNDNRLALTPKTEELIPYLDSAFVDVTDRLIHELFDGDENVRKLLVKYVVLQLLSDGAFCLNRWEQKGGGSQRHADSRPLEKWLWRCLWDCYIASHVQAKFL